METINIRLSANACGCQGSKCNENLYQTLIQLNGNNLVFADNYEYTKVKINNTNQDHTLKFNVIFNGQDKRLIETDKETHDDLLHKVSKYQSVTAKLEYTDQIKCETTQTIHKRGQVVLSTKIDNQLTHQRCKKPIGTGDRQLINKLKAYTYRVDIFTENNQIYCNIIVYCASPDLDYDFG